MSAKVPPDGVSRQGALERFHVRTRDGRVLSGAAAFIEVWTHVPGWRWAARVASLPGASAGLEFGYGMFLRVRPWISRLVGAVQGLSRSARDDGHPRQ